MQPATIARFLVAVGGLALLSACASGPRVTARVESSRYLSRSGRTYTPPGPPGDPWGPYISEAAAKYDVPEKWVREVMRQESGGKQLATSGAGAMGLMQVMPATYDDLRGRYSELTDDPYDPHNNILAGTAYLREMFDIYGSPGFLAAYNAGPGRLDDYLTNNRTLPAETRRYVASIGPRIAGYEPRKPSPGAQYAMNALPAAIPDGPRYAPSSRYSAPIQLAAVQANPIQLAPVPPPAQVAELAPPPAQSSGGPFIVLRPPPPEVAQAPVFADAYAGAPAPIRLNPPVEVAEAPEPAPLPAPVIARLPEPPRFAQTTPARVPEPPRLATFAQLPEPPMPVAPPRTQQQLAAAALVPLGPHGFSLVRQANAEPIAPHNSGGWAIQVGAFANEGLASAATVSARGQARELAAARSSVTPVQQGRGTLYRARITGLSHDSAVQACERLSRSRTNCILVAPNAQS